MAKKWIKPRHKLTKIIISPFFRAYFKIALKFKKKDIELPKNQPCLVCYNHQTNLDPFLVGFLMGKRNFYYLASEHIFSKGFLSKLLKFFIAPVPFLKGGMNTKPIMTCARIVKEGGSIIISPEGNRTYTGETTYIKETIVKFVRFLKIPLVLVNVKGNYTCRPRWAKSRRKGQVNAFPVRTVLKEEYDKLTDQELLNIIKEGLYVNESDDKLYYKNRKKNNAEYLERFLYLCPNCGVVHFNSKGNNVTCEKCGLTATFDNYKRFSGVKFSTLKEWGDYQQEFVKNFSEQGEITSDKIDFYKNKRENKIRKVYKKATLTLFADKISIEKDAFLFENMEGMSVVGDNLLYFHYDGNTYRIDGGKRFNAVKYLDFYNKYKGER